METIGKNKEFESAAKALHQDWAPERVHHLIKVVDDFVAAALAKQAEAAPSMAEPNADDYVSIELCDIYTHIGIDGKWYTLAELRAALNQRAGRVQPEEESEHDVAVLLRLRQPMADGTPVHVIITKNRYKELGNVEELNAHDKFLYNEHTCPTNWLGVECIMDGSNCDPHGIFEHVQTIEIPPGTDMGLVPEMFSKLDTTVQRTSTVEEGADVPLTNEQAWNAIKEVTGLDMIGWDKKAVIIIADPEEAGEVAQAIIKATQE